MNIIDVIKQKIIQIFNIQPAMQQSFSVFEEMTQQTNVLKNRIWYRGSAVELEQFFGQLYTSDCGRFWSSSGGKKIRKIHLGFIDTVIDRYADIVSSDFNGITVDGNMSALWNETAKQNDFNGLLENAIKETLIVGDGAFKIAFDSKISNMPIISFVPADNVDYTFSNGKITEVIFYHSIKQGATQYKLAEIYGYGYIKYKLFTASGTETELSVTEETAHLSDVVFTDEIMLAVPLKIFSSSMYKGRGKALFDGKTDEADALDEVVSQWLDAVRKGRVKKYIPESLIPRNPYTGETDIHGFDYDDDFVAIKSQISETATDQIITIQPQINYEAYVNSYTSYLDMLLQGIISPSTLGIDLKKTDNAESQREKEKVTMYVRSKIVASVVKAVAELVNICLNVCNIVNGKSIADYEVSVNFGEYASTDFASVIATVGDAYTKGIMSIERCVDELYGETLTEEEKAEEVARLKAEKGIEEVDIGGLMVDEE